MAEEQTKDAETKIEGSLAGFEPQTPIWSVSSLIKTKKYISLILLISTSLVKMKKRKKVAGSNSKYLKTELHFLGYGNFMSTIGIQVNSNKLWYNFTIASIDIRGFNSG